MMRFPSSTVEPAGCRSNAARAGANATGAGTQTRASCWAVAGEASNANNANNATRTTERRTGTSTEQDAHRYSLRFRYANQLVDPDRSDRNPFDVTDARRDPGVEPPAEPEIRPQAQIEVDVAPAPGDEECSGLDVRHDADGRILHVEPAAEGEADRDDQHRVAGDQVGARAEDQRAVQRKVFVVREHAF